MPTSGLGIFSRNVVTEIQYGMGLSESLENSTTPQEHVSFYVTEFEQLFFKKTITSHMMINFERVWIHFILQVFLHTWNGDFLFTLKPNKENKINWGKFFVRRIKLFFPISQIFRKAIQRYLLESISTKVANYTHAVLWNISRKLMIKSCKRI